MTTRTLRVGTVDYLNARPLTQGIERGAPDLAIELSSAVPALLAERMLRGEIDVALLPIVELARAPELEIVPDVAIAARGAARSVLLVGRDDPRSIATLALDPESRTSNVLARVVLDLVWGVRPEVVAGDVDLDRALSRADAAVRIGDKALFETPPRGTMIHDLADEWTRATGLPFVFAVWAARPGVIDEGVRELLLRARSEGLRSIDAIARDYAFRGRRDPALARDYLTKNIRYELGPDELRAMERFFRHAAELGCIDSAPSIRLALAEHREGVSR